MTVLSSSPCGALPCGRNLVPYEAQVAYYPDVFLPLSPAYQHAGSSQISCDPLASPCLRNSLLFYLLLTPITMRRVLLIFMGYATNPPPHYPLSMPWPCRAPLYLTCSSCPLADLPARKSLIGRKDALVRELLEGVQGSRRPVPNKCIVI